MRSSDDVRRVLKARGVPHEIVRMPTPAPSAQRAADELGVHVGQVVKSLLFILDEGRPVLVLVSGDVTVDTTTLARETGAREVRLARPAEVLQLTGYPAGAVSPCALETDLRIVADPGVVAAETVYCGGGTTETMLRIVGADLAALLAPEVIAVATAP